MVRIDNNIIKSPENFGKLKGKIAEALAYIDEPDKKDKTGNGDFRYKGVSIEGLDKKVDIDLTFTKRTDEIEYTTDECIKDRLETIKRHNPEDYKYVLANILLAKKVLKTEGVYKKATSGAPKPGEKDTRGGIGAVGIENWVLQNGGSFEKAARSFLEVAKKCSNISEFITQYTVWDFGENYTAKEKDKYPHDNFINNMNGDGYEKMKKALEDYLKAISIERDKEESDKKGLAQIVQEDMSVLNDTIYMQSVENLMNRAKEIERSEQINIGE